MTIKDWLLVGFWVLWVFSLIILVSFGNRHFKNARAEKYREIAVNAAKQWVAFMDRQKLDDGAKFNQAVNQVMKELTAHGYKIGDQKEKDIEALVEWAVTQLRMEEAKAGINTAAKPDTKPELAQDVPDSDIVQPTVPEGDANGK